MRTKLKLLLVGAIALGLLITGTASALTSQAAESISDFVDTQALPPEDVDALIAELEAIENVEIIPRPEEEGAEVKILGGFHGKWGVNEADDPLGGMVGIYGTVTSEDGTGYGFMGGIWRQRGEKTGGYLIGRYADGAFWGIYRNYAGEAGGRFDGSYTNNTDAVEARINRFTGTWQSSNDEQVGYIKGSWAKKVSIKRIGKFGGQWIYPEQNADVEEVADRERPEADGKLRGNYAAMKLANGKVIHLFRGGWRNAEGDNGKLTGIGIRGHFYGIWQGEEESGYMMGRAKDHRLRGVWGTFGQEEQGRLRGRYNRIPRPEQVEPGQVEPEPVFTLEPILVPAA